MKQIEKGEVRYRACFCFLVVFLMCDLKNKCVIRKEIIKYLPVEIILVKREKRMM